MKICTQLMNFWEKITIQIRDRNGAGRDNDGTKRGGDSVKSSKFPRV